MRKLTLGMGLSLVLAATSQTLLLTTNAMAEDLPVENLHQRLCVLNFNHSDASYGVSGAPSNTWVFKRDEASGTYLIDEGYAEIGRLKNGKVLRHFKFFFDTESNNWTETRESSPKGMTVIYPKATLEFRRLKVQTGGERSVEISVQSSCEFQNKECYASTHFDGLSINWNVSDNERLSQLENRTLGELLATISTGIKTAFAKANESQNSYDEVLKCRNPTNITNEQFQLTDNHGKKALPDRVLIGGAKLLTKPVGRKSQLTKIEVSQVWKSMSTEPRLSESDFNTVLAMTAGVPIQTISTDGTSHKKLLDYESYPSLQLLDQRERIKSEIARARKYDPKGRIDFLAADNAKRNVLYRIDNYGVNLKDWKFVEVPLPQSDTTALYVYRSNREGDPYRILKCKGADPAQESVKCLTTLDNGEWRYVIEFSPDANLSWKKMAKKIDRQFPKR